MNRIRKALVGPIFAVAAAAAPLFHGGAHAGGIDPIEFCGINGGFAASIMKARQNGRSMMDMMELVQKSEMGEEYKDLAKSIVMGAYELPRWATDDSKAKAVEDYQNAVESTCYSAMTSD